MDHLWHRLLQAAPPVDDVIRRDLLVQSAQASMLTNLMGLGLLFMVLVTLRDGAGRELAVWGGLLLANTVFFHLAVRWHVQHQPQPPARVHRQQLTLTCVFVVCGLAWGSLALLGLRHGGRPAGDLGQPLAVVCFSVVIAVAGNIAFASATPGPFLGFHLSATLSSAVGLLWAGAPSLAAFMMFAALAALPLQRDLYLQISGAKLTARRNHLLAEELRAERAAVEQTNLRLVEANVELSHRATRDPLTGLANRALFSEHLSSTLARSRQVGRSLSVIYFDLDRFKLINDTLGHAAGDELLRQIGPRITEVLRDSDVLARLGGDEFIVLTLNGENPAVGETVAHRILARFEVPFQIEDRELRVTPSLGVAHDDGHSTGEQLVANADAALYRAKELGRNRVEMFDGSLRLLLRQRGQVGQVLEFEDGGGPSSADP